MYQPPIDIEELENYELRHQYAASFGRDTHKTLDIVFTRTGTKVYEVFDRRKLVISTPLAFLAIKEYEKLP